MHLSRASIVALSIIILPVTSLTLGDVCTQTYVQSKLFTINSLGPLIMDASSVTTSAVANYSVSGSNSYPDASFSYCNVTFAYSHAGRDDVVHVQYWLPAPADFRNRYLSTGGGGLAINSGGSSLAGGVMYGATAGLTDGGFGSFSTQFDSVFLLSNGTINYEALFMFGYQAHHELTTIGKQLTRNFFSMANSTKLFAYYQACSEGGREGWSQIQRYADDWDGAVVGAPAFRFSFQQVQHLFSGLVEETLNYFPPQCELDKIINATIAACDPMDGKTDGVVSRTDLCGLNFNLNSTIGVPYYCPPSSAKGGFPGGPPSGAIPAQNGTITAKGVQVASQIVSGLHDSQGRRVYFSYQPAASFDDGATTYNSTSGRWYTTPSGIGAEFVTRFLELQNTSSLPSFAGITYDSLKEWSIKGMQMYEDTLQTTWPDLTPYHSAGGKILHFHGESDNSIPTASSVRYYESVRNTMYPDLSYNESTAALDDWYRLFLVPGAAHCSPNPLQPNGPFPQTNLAVLIDWVENGNVPERLNATYLAGAEKGGNAEICSWPLRPLWRSGNGGNGTLMLDCVYDQKSIDSWMYDLDGVPVPVY